MRIVRELPEAVRVVRHVWIPMRDGLRLSARLWLPESSGEAPAPAILEYIPYRKDDHSLPGDERATATGQAMATRACASTCAAAATPRACSWASTWRRSRTTPRTYSRGSPSSRGAADAWA